MFGGKTLPEIVTSDEASNESRRRMLVHSLGVAELLDVPIKHDRDAIAHAHGFFLIMRHENKSDAEATLQQLEFDLHFFA